MKRTEKRCYTHTYQKDVICIVNLIPPIRSLVPLPTFQRTKIWFVYLAIYYHPCRFVVNMCFPEKDIKAIIYRSFSTVLSSVKKTVDNMKLSFCLFLLKTVTGQSLFISFPKTKCFYFKVELRKVY